jgi:TonB family protein
MKSDIPSDEENYMQVSNRPFAASTVLSILVHGALFLSLVFVLEHTTSVGQDIANDIQLELLASDVVVDESAMNNQSMQDPETTEAVVSEVVPSQLQSLKQVNAEAKPVTNSATDALTESDAIDEQVLTTDNSDDVINDVQRVTEGMVADRVEPATSAIQTTVVTQAVDHQLVALLHSHISEHKQYPYLARRQRREGVATVSFVLHPNGEIENTHLVNSSRTALLDRAALSAVEKIEPFEAAHNYLETAETFNIDVVFELM